MRTMTRQTQRRNPEARETLANGVMMAFMAGANAAFFLSVYTYTDVFAQIF